MTLANTDGSRRQYGRKIALTVGLNSLEGLKQQKQSGMQFSILSVRSKCH